MSRLNWLKSLFMIAAVTIMIVGATRALFTDTRQNQHNAFSSGTLRLQLLDADSNPLPEPLFACDNWYPGCTDIKYLQIKNVGTLPCAIDWMLILESEQVGANGERLGNILQAEIREDANGDDTYETLKYAGCLQELTEPIDIGVTDPDESRRIQIRITFDANGGNGYQGLSNMYTMAAAATQV